jgi:hypothetical protein
MDDLKEKLCNLLSEYFGIGDSYAYNLTRDKAAFGIGTVTMDDFEEFDADTVSVSDNAVQGTTASFMAVGVWLAADGPGNAKIWNGVVDRGVIHEVVGTCLDHMILEICGIIGCGVSVVSGVMEYQILNVPGSAAATVIAGVCPLFFQNITHVSDCAFFSA